MKIFAVLIVLSMARMILAADYKPAATPLLTRWSKDVKPDKVWAEYPRPQMVRQRWQSLNGLWEFSAGDGDAGEILVPFCVESALSGVGKHYDKLTYRRVFEIPSDWKGKRVVLHFGAVDYECTVAVNGRAVPLPAR